MMDEKPKVADFLVTLTGRDNVSSLIWAAYLFPAIVFFALLRLEQMTWRARGAGVKVPSSKREKSAEPSISIRADGELRSVGELAGILGNQDLELAEKEH